MNDTDKYLEKMVMRFFHALTPNCHGEPSVEMRKAIAIFREVEKHGYERAMKLANERHSQIMAGSK